MKDQKVSLLIPTYNAGAKWPSVLEGVGKQSISFSEKIIIDSGSSDHTIELAKKYGFRILKITKKEFNHGYARQLMVEAAVSSEICAFLTQDAILVSADSIERLIGPFKDADVGLSYGRQLPHDGATPIESHARFFNYPEISNFRSFDDKQQYGFKVFFCSNSFSAYRKSVLTALGGFPSKSIIGEDALFAAKMLKKGYKLAYVAEAMVKHSHNYSFEEEFKRYFDTRVFHEQNKWLQDTYGKPIGEGFRYAKSELRYIINTDLRFLPYSFNSLFAKWLGYKTGKYYKYMSKTWLQKLSMHSGYWH